MSRGSNREEGCGESEGQKRDRIWVSWECRISEEGNDNIPKFPFTSPSRPRTRLSAGL